jgi:hypothetical protein
MNPLNRLSLQIASCILTGVSVVFTVLLWGQLPAESWMKIVAGLAGFALELCKFSLFPIAFLLLKNKKTLGTGVGLLLIGGLLFVVSIGASVSFLENGEQARQQQSALWQERQTTLTQLDERIRISQLSAAKDIDGGYRQRGLDTLKNVDEWQEKRETLINNPVIETAGVGGMNESQRFYAWLLLAILIDGCAVAGWSILSQEQNDKHEEHFPEKESEAKSANSMHHLEKKIEMFLRTQESRESHSKLFLKTESIQEVEQETENNIVNMETETITTNSEEVSSEPKAELIVVDSDLIDRVLSGEHGTVLTIRGIMSKEKIGYRKVKNVFDSLQNDELLVDTGKGYVLAGSSADQQCLKYG